MSWYLDFIGYQCFDRGFISKEIAILHDSGDRCYNYFVTGPREYPVIYSSTIQHQYQMHNLRWECGDYEFNEAMMDIARKLRQDTVYIKGRQKFEFMHVYFQDSISLSWSVYQHLKTLIIVLMKDVR